MYLCIFKLSNIMSMSNRKHPVLLALLLTFSCLTGAAQSGHGLHISVTPDTRMTGRSNHREVLMRIQVVRGTETQETELNSLTVNLQGTKAGDVRILEVLSTRNSPRPTCLGPQSVLQESTTYDSPRE